VLGERERQILALLGVTTMSKSPQKLTVRVGLVTLSTPIRRRTSRIQRPALRAAADPVRSPRKARWGISA